MKCPRCGLIQAGLSACPRCLLAGLDEPEPLPENPQGLELLEEIRENPAEDTARLVYADWLQEQDDDRDPGHAGHGQIEQCPGWEPDSQENPF